MLELTFCDHDDPKPIKTLEVTPDEYVYLEIVRLELAFQRDLGRSMLDWERKNNLESLNNMVSYVKDAAPDTWFELEYYETLREALQRKRVSDRVDKLVEEL